MSKIGRMRAKYAKRKSTSGRMFFPPGGEDMQAMCDVAERLLSIIRELQHGQDVGGKNETERKLWGIL